MTIYSLIYPFYCKRGRIYNFITNSKEWNLIKLNNIISKEIITKIKAIPIRLTNIGYNLETTNGEFSVKMAIWVNNNPIPTHPKANMLNALWRLNLFPRVKLFAWKLIRQKLSTKSRLRKLGSSINGDCPSCNQADENIDHIFKQCNVIKSIWATIDTYFPSPNNSISRSLIG